jgi:murein DD-endopeptidase MepM/ murein hydrolase activator NlpD
MVVKSVVKKEVIDYKTKTVYRDDKPVTHNKVTTKGKEGSKDVTYEYVYLDGVEIEVSKVSEVITAQPVTKVVEIGTKKTYTSGGSEVVQGDGIYTGDWAWPVPVCHNVYQGYHGGHLAWDISSGPTPVFRTPCLAVDGGTVTYAGWYYGYGYYIKIDHGNGIQTTYAHLDSISVVVGQRVSNGQQIGKVGNSGNSKGPHLHFEVIKNGVRVNPKKYFDPKDWY